MNFIKNQVSGAISTNLGIAGPNFQEPNFFKVMIF